MANVTAERVSAEMNGEFVVFLIEIEINRKWKIHKWLPVFRARKKMLEELMAHPELGCMSHKKSGGIVILYWRTFEQLEYFARESDKELWPAWAAFNEKLEQSRGDVGVWREIYVIKPGQSETIESGTRALGLSKMGHLVSRSGPQSQAGDRLKTEVA
jgi:hypothetical protein